MAVEITVRCYGPARHEAGGETVIVTVDDASTVDVDDVLAALVATRGPGDGLVLLLPHCAVAVDDELVPRDFPLGDATELALLPPVAGG